MEKVVIKIFSLERPFQSALAAARPHKRALDLRPLSSCGLEHAVEDRWQLCVQDLQAMLGDPARGSDPPGDLRRGLPFLREKESGAHQRL